MALRLEDKKALVAEVSAVAAKAQSVVAAEYRGLTVTQMTDLRAKARKSGVYMRVVKNTLARKAIAGTRSKWSARAEGSAGSRVLEGRSGRRRARGQGLREDQRQAHDDSRVARRRGAARRRISTGSRACRRASRRCRMLLGVIKAPIAEARPHARRTAGQARAHHRRGPRPETGRGLICLTDLD